MRRAACAALLIAWLLGLAAMAAGNEWLMRAGFSAYGASPLIPKAASGQVAEDLSRYLSGRADTLAASSASPAYSARETRHLKDVKGLVLAGRALFFLSCVGLAIAQLGLWHRASRRALSSAVRQGCLIALGVLVALGISGAALGFEKLFTLFHHLAFTNDLWLLSPEEDILIGLMPLAFFKRMSLIIGTVYLLSVAALYAEATYLLRHTA